MKLASYLLPLAIAFSTGPSLASEAFDEIKLNAGAALFDLECRRCHAVGSQDPSYGPPLENIVGRAAGSVEDYDYSIALEASGVVWTPAALRAWLEDNAGFMPGTKMRHVGISDRTVQDFILFYLESISDVERNKQASE
ncbi:MAG: cytochrome C [Paracoccaceae bacterium]|nr:cytochrome C [Paracoccaceae bacterium]